MPFFGHRPPTKFCVNDRSVSQSSCAAVSTDPFCAISNSRARISQYDFESGPRDETSEESLLLKSHTKTRLTLGKPARSDAQEQRKMLNLDTIWFEDRTEEVQRLESIVHRSNVEHIRNYCSPLQLWLAANNIAYSRKRSQIFFGATSCTWLPKQGRKSGKHVHHGETLMLLLAAVQKLRNIEYLGSLQYTRNVSQPRQIMDVMNESDVAVLREKRWNFQARKLSFRRTSGKLGGSQNPKATCHWITVQPLQINGESCYPHIPGTQSSGAAFARKKGTTTST